MASERPDSSGSMGDGWTPSPELLEDRELLSGVVDGLTDLAAAAPVEEAAVVPNPGAEPPAVVAPPAEVSASAVAAQAPASALASHAAESAAVEHATAPGAEAVDSLLAHVAVKSQSHTHAVSEGEARVSADVTAARATEPAPAPGTHAVNAPATGSVSAHDGGTAASWVGAENSTESELEFSPTDEDAAQPHMMADVSSGERAAETVVQDMPTLNDNQSEEAEAPIERSLIQSPEDHPASVPSLVSAEHETARDLQAGAVTIVEPAESKPELASRVSQLFDQVPNWPGVDLDALEDAARSRVADGADSVDVVSTHDASCWAATTAGTAVGLGIARRELGLQTRDTVDGPADDEVERGARVTS